jgi:hypothetical protein
MGQISCAKPVSASSSARRRVGEGTAAAMPAARTAAILALASGGTIAAGLALGCNYPQATHFQRTVTEPASNTSCAGRLCIPTCCGGDGFASKFVESSAQVGSAEGLEGVKSKKSEPYLAHKYSRKPLPA